MDLTVSLGSGTPFLGRWPANKPRTVFISGESGPLTLQEAAKRIALSKGINDHPDCHVKFRLPKLAAEQELYELARGVKAAGIEVVILDPLCLCLLSGQNDKNASNLFDMGPLLLQVSQAILGAGATPVLVHHAKKALFGFSGEPLELDDLAFAGIQEFARQWILINRRAKYEPKAPAELWLPYGGSAGHGGIVGLDIQEGTLNADFTGRTWEVEVRSVNGVRVADQEKRAAAKEEKKQHEDEVNSQKLLDLLTEPKTVNELKNALGWNSDKMARVLLKLKDEVDVNMGKKQTANGGYRPAQFVSRKLQTD